MTLNVLAMCAVAYAKTHIANPMTTLGIIGFGIAALAVLACAFDERFVFTYGFTLMMSIVGCILTANHKNSPVVPVFIGFLYALAFWASGRRDHESFDLKGALIVTPPLMFVGFLGMITICKF